MNPYTLLAKLAVETYVKEKKIILPPKNLPKELLTKRAGAFVTIEKEGRLRGCIGTYLPTKENLAKEIIQNAVAAATEDYRFGQIRAEELPRLSYVVYVLQKPRLVKNIKELNPKKYGIIIRNIPIFYSDYKKDTVMFNGVTPPKSGLLLPDLEGINTVEEQISIACQKAGIDPTVEQILIYKFTAEKH